MSEITIEVRCRECGQLLDTWSPRIGYIEVIPCDTCLDSANADGYRESKCKAVKAGGDDE